MADRSEKVKTLIERRRKSLDFYAPQYEEFVEVQRAAKCMTVPIMVTGKDGKEVEDKTRTNVCMPGISIMHRKNKARLTAQPPKLKFIGAKSQDIADSLTSWAYMQYDMTDEAIAQRKNVGQAELFGISVTKVYQDDVQVRRNVRVRTTQATRSQILKQRGLQDEQIQQEVAQSGEQLSPDEVNGALAEFGDEIKDEQITSKYSGPVVKWCFIGDIHFPPDCESLDTAAWIIEEYTETAIWLEYWMERTYCDESGAEVKVFDSEECDKMVAEDKELPINEKTTLRERFRAIAKQDPTDMSQKTLAVDKRFRVMECHEKRNGKNWIFWVGNDNRFLGEMPYPWDFNGKYAYTALVPLPDLISVIGDSTPRLARHLHRMHNAAVGARTDLINQTLRPFALTRIGSDIPEEATERGVFRELKVKNLTDVQIERLPEVPSEAWETEAAILRQMAMLEPALASPDAAGTSQNPQAGKTATTAVLAQRSVDTLTQDKIDALDIYWKEVGQKKLWILQQTTQKNVKVAQKYLNQGQIQQAQAKLPAAVQPPTAPPAPQTGNVLNIGQPAISMRYGHAVEIEIDPFEIQEDIQVEPEAGSTLAIDDEFHRMAAQNLLQMALSAPQVFNVYEAAMAYAMKIKGVDATKVVRPEPPPSPEKPKMSVNYSFPMDKMATIAPNFFNEAIQAVGFTEDPEVMHNATIEGVKKVGEAADAAAKLAEPAVPNEPPLRKIAGV